ncbi:MAG: cytochrome c [Roseivirga sp.]|nr:cytochrome c [Roseivirga sp.]
MRKYLEPAIMICLALALGLTFKQESSEGVKDSVVVNGNDTSWRLDVTKLQGDTLIHLPFDPYFKAPKTYKAFPLTANLKAFFGADIKEESLDVIFECADGYKPHMSLEKALAGNGYLAYHDLAASEGSHWPDSVAGTLAPFYLVWPDVEAGNKDYVRPYALIGIELKKAEVEFAAAIPRLAKHMEGYDLFSSTCMKCHSMNKAGGAKAPEFNFPKNITEYWTKENIWAFIQDPTSFRYSSQMPAMTSIDRADFEKIYAYLESMKTQKPSE